MQKGKKWGLLVVTMLLAVTVLSACSSSKQSSRNAASTDSKQAVPEIALSADSGSTADSAQGSGSSSEMKAADQYGKFTAATGMNLDNNVQPPAESVSSDGSGNTSQIADGFDRKLIYHANLTMEVKDYADAQTQIRDKTALSGGYVLQFSDSKTLHEEGGTFVLKIPSSGFFSFIQQLEQMKPVSLQRSVQGQDVTEQYVDLSARLKAKQVVEQRLLTFMDKAQKVDDLLKFSNQLASVQEEIEQLKGKIRYLDQNVAFSTVELRVYQRVGDGPFTADSAKKSLAERALFAMKTSMNWMYGFATGFIVFVAGALPILIPIAIIAFLAVAIYRKYRTKSHYTTHNTLNPDDSGKSD